MSQISRILKWTCAFAIAAAVAQLLSLLPWSFWVVGIVAAIAYSVGFKQDDWQLQIIASGLIFGLLKCFYGG
ncbi:MAG: hypothetical protein ACFKPT_02800 [Gloeotrichia echinulata GP01]